MSKVKRYNGFNEESEDGDWVRYSDYKSKVATHSVTKHYLESCLKWIDSATSREEYLKEQLAAYEKASKEDQAYIRSLRNFYKSQIDDLRDELTRLENACLLYVSGDVPLPPELDRAISKAKNRMTFVGDMGVI